MVEPGDRLPGIPRHSFKAGVRQGSPARRTWRSRRSWRRAGSSSGTRGTTSRSSTATASSTSARRTASMAGSRGNPTPAIPGSSVPARRGARSPASGYGSEAAWRRGRQEEFHPWPSVRTRSRQAYERAVGRCECLRQSCSAHYGGRCGRRVLAGWHPPDTASPYILVRIIFSNSLCFRASVCCVFGSFRFPKRVQSLPRRFIAGTCRLLAAFFAARSPRRS